jgi:hypothetical protein
MATANTAASAAIFEALRSARRSSSRPRAEAASPTAAEEASPCIAASTGATIVAKRSGESMQGEASRVEEVGVENLGGMGGGVGGDLAEPVKEGEGLLGGGGVQVGTVKSTAECEGREDGGGSSWSRSRRRR